MKKTTPDPAKVLTRNGKRWCKRWVNPTREPRQKRSYYFGRLDDDPTIVLARYEAWLEQRDQDDTVPEAAQVDPRQVVEEPADPNALPNDFPLKLNGDYFYYYWPGEGQKSYGHRRDPEGARERWIADCQNRMEPESEVTVHRVVTFVKLTYEKMQQKELRGGSPNTINEINWIGDLMIQTFGGYRDWESLTPDDWERLRAKMELGRNGEGLGHLALKRAYSRPKRFGKMATDEYGVRSPAFGFTTFQLRDEKKTPSTVNRLGKSPISSKAYDQHEIEAILVDAPPFERACCLLGLNGGMGLADIGNILTTQFCMVSGWFDDSRTKTGKARRFRLWPETIQAIQEELRRQPRSEEYPDHVFVGDKLLRPMVRKIGTMTDTQQLNKRVLAHIRSRGFKDRRGFYGFRHTFQWAGAAIDSEATSDIMTHTPMSSQRSGKLSYDSGKHDRRRAIVTDFIRQWALLGGSDDPADFVASSESLYGTLPAPVPLCGGSREGRAG